MNYNMDTKTLNEALRIDLELLVDEIDFSKMTIHSDENGLYIESKIEDILTIVREIGKLSFITEESILRKYSMHVNFEDSYISFIRNDYK